MQHEKQHLDMEMELLETKFEAEKAQIEVDFSITFCQSKCLVKVLDKHFEHCLVFFQGNSVFRRSVESNSPENRNRTKQSSEPWISAS